MSQMKSVILFLLFLSPFASGAQLVFSEAPEGFSPRFEVAACFLKVGDEFLFLHRTPTSSEGNKWGIPGGKIDKGESSQKGVIREVWEETGLTMKDADLKYLGKVYIRQLVPAKDFIYHMYEYKLQDKFDVKLNPKEHKGFTWMTLSDSLDYSLIQGEAECIDRAYRVRKEASSQCSSASAQKSML